MSRRARNGDAGAAGRRANPGSPERVLEAARDFSERRPELWPDVHPDHFVVHRAGDGFAEVTEGNPSPIGPFWERLPYEWSEPGRVRAVVIDSNIFKAGSTWEIAATPAAGGVGAILVPTGLARRTLRSHLRHFLGQLEGERQPTPV